VFINVVLKHEASSLLLMENVVITGQNACAAACTVVGALGGYAFGLNNAGPAVSALIIAVTIFGMSPYIYMMARDY